MVNGILIDTEEDTSSKPIAVIKGFFSGRARAAILRKEDALVGVFEKVPGSTLDNTEGFFVGGGGGVEEELGLDSLGCGRVVAKVLETIGKRRGVCNRECTPKLRLEW